RVSWSQIPPIGRNDNGIVLFWNEDSISVLLPSEVRNPLRYSRIDQGIPHIVRRGGLRSE
ncbi:MAG TPA: hypothetical protein VFO76_00375, partial [Candidatus Kapabacteria bacterium]|nr:hypothetical protein [Candidatus Kapabacteria bacterium]